MAFHVNAKYQISAWENGFVYLVFLLNKLKKTKKGNKKKTFLTEWNGMNEYNF